MNSRFAIALIWILLAPVLSLAAEAKIAALHLESAPVAKAMWLVEVREGDRPDARYSRIYWRNEGELGWTLVRSVPADVTQVTRYGDDLVMLLASGEWIVGQSSGRRLPGGVKIMSIAGDDRALYCIGETAPAATTRPGGVEAAMTTTAPTTQSLGLSLYQLVRGQWQLKTALPRQSAGAVVLGLAEGVPTVASTQNGRLTAWQLGNQGKWTSLGSVEGVAGTPSKLFRDSGRTFIYVGEQSGPSELLVRNSQWLDPIPLPTKSVVRGIGLAGGQVRFLYAEQEQIKERRLSPRDLQIQGADTAVLLPQPVDIDRIRGYVHWVMMGLITLVMIHTYRKRDEYRQVKLDWNRLELAPFGRRFFAGMIDLVPALAALLYARANLGIETPTDIVQSVAAFRLVGIGILVFLAHTTIIEAIAGRSIGKIITHLQIVRIDGKRPGVWALLLRNVLRVVDVVLMFTLILMVYLPLRQRLGDLAAGTVVVADRQHDMGGPDA